MHVLGTGSQSGTGDIRRHITSADHNRFTAERYFFTHADLAQKIQAIVNTFEVFIFAGNADVLAGLGFHVVDLHKETDREWWQMRRYVSANRARQMRKFRNSYVKSGLNILNYVASEDAAKILGQTWRKDFAVQPGIEALRRGEMPTRGTLLGYLASPSVQLEALKKKLTRAGVSSDERKQINLRMRQLKEMRRLEDFKRIKFEEVPAIFRRLMMSANKKIEADNQRDG